MTLPILSLETRAASLAAMSNEEELDILVIGGGVTGAGIALDAASRGLKIGIVEAQDWAAGTSSRSSKLVHGGLRYLYQLDFKLVAEALRERGLLLETTAPHLVKAQPFLWPLKLPVIERLYSAVGVGMYDAMAQMAHPGSVPIQKHLSKSGTKQMFPGVKSDAMIGSIRFYDARVNDARLVVSLVRTAVKYGALAANRTKVTALTKDSSGRVTGATVKDLQNGAEHKIKARKIITATGVWTENTEEMAATKGGLKVLASKGIHIVVPKARIKGSAGIFLRTEKSVLFIIPWKRYWIIGTTDTKYQEDLVHPVANSEDIDYVLEHANTVLDDPLTRDDIISTYAGLRPLLQPGTRDGDKTKSTKVSREHTVTEAAPGLVVIAGGKLTTYRPMSEDAVDFALGKKNAKAHPCVTQKTPLVGADGYHAMWNARENIATRSGLSVDQVEDLLDTYGSEIDSILTLIEKDESLGKSLNGAPEHLRAEVAFGVIYEGALHLEDILVRRLSLSVGHRDYAKACTEEVADIMSPLLGWSKKQREQEIESYLQACAAKTDASFISDEHAAQEARSSVSDIIPFDVTTSVKSNKNAIKQN